jgi:hypothetical protein
MNVMNTNKKNSWTKGLLTAVFVIGGTLNFTSCAVNDNQGENKGRQYTNEVYAYLNKANEREAIDATAAKRYQTSWSDWKKTIKR